MMMLMINFAAVFDLMLVRDALLQRFCLMMVIDLLQPQVLATAAAMIMNDFVTHSSVGTLLLV
jgi:hypothetical protein